MKNLHNKKYGMGTLSLIVCMIGVFFSFSTLDGRYCGKRLLCTTGLSSSPVIISIILFLISIFIGNTFKNDFGSKIGTTLSMIFMLLIMFFSILSPTI